MFVVECLNMPRACHSSLARSLSSLVSWMNIFFASFICLPHSSVMCEFINSFDSAKVSFDSSATSGGGGWYHSTKIVSTNCQSSINYLCINVNFLLFIEKLMKLIGIAGSVKFLNRTNFYDFFLLLLINFFNEKLPNTLGKLWRRQWTALKATLIKMI